MLTSIKVFTGNTITAGQPVGITLNKVQGVLEKGVKYSLQFKVINYSSINTLDYIYVGTQKISNIDISQGTVIDTVDGKEVRLCSVEFTASSKVTNPVIKIGRNMVSSDTSNTLMYELTDFQLERGYKTNYSPNSNDLQIVKTDLESKINQLADSLQFYVAKNDFDNLGNTVSSALGQIDVSTGEISLKVEQTDIDNAKNELEGSIDKKISNAKAEIKMTTDSISQRVSSTESTTSTLTNKVTVVESTANTANSNATNALDKANTASTNASNAVTTANKANTTASTANTNATTALNTANSAKDTASSASTKADNAVSTANTAKSTADKAQTTANSANTLANTANNTANTNKNNITTLQTTVTTTNNRVAELTTNLDGITQRVASNEETITTTNAKLDGLQVGGRNYIPTSGNFTNSVGNWESNGSTISIDSSVTYFEYNTIKIGSNSLSGINYNKWIKLKPNTTYTYSITAKADKVVTGVSYDTPLHMWLKDDPNSSEIHLETIEDSSHNNISTSWGRSYVVFKTPNNAEVYYWKPFIYGKGDATVWVANFQCEEGNKPSDWTPPIEEVQSQIDNVDSKVQATNSKVASIETNLNGITQRVSSTESTVSSHTTQLGTVDTRINNAKNSAISTASSDATTKANNALADAKTYTNGQITTVNTTINNKVAEIKATTDAITQRVSSTEATTTTLNSKVNTAQSTADSATTKANNAQNTANTANSTANTNKNNISSLTTRVSTAESKLTKDSLTTTIGSHYTTSSDVNGIVTSKGYATTSQVQQTKNELTATFKSSGGYNLIRNGSAKLDTSGWSNNGGGIGRVTGGKGGVVNSYFSTTFPNGITTDSIELKNNTDYVYQAMLYIPNNTITGSSTTPLHFWCNTSPSSSGNPQLTILDYSQNIPTANTWTKCYVHFRTASSGNVYFKPFIYTGGASMTVYVSEIMLCESSVPLPYSPHPSEIYDGITKIDKDGITVTQSNAKTKTTMSADGFAITRTDKNADIFRVGSNGLLTLNGVFKCYKDNANMSGARLESSGAIMFGYNNSTSTKPVFASGLWTDENMGYFSVGYTRADVTDENGCLWMSPQQGNNGCRLTYSKLVGGNMASTNLYFQKDGALLFSSNINGLNSTDDRYTYQFDSGVSTRALRCDNLRTYHIYPRNTGSSNIGSPSMRYRDIFADSLSTTNNQLRLGTVKSDGSWQTYGALDINSSTGYIFPHKGNGQLSLGTSGNRFHGIYLVNSPNVSSDERLKTDIHYLDEPMPEEPTILDGRVERNMKITTKDMYDFVKDDLKLASYRYNLNLERGNTSTDYGFIAQDILYTKVGSELIQLEDKEDLNSTLSYNQGNYISTIVGALQEAINKIEVLEKKVQELESKLI